MRKILMLAIFGCIVLACSESLIEEPIQDTTIIEETEELQTPTEEQIKLAYEASLAFAGLKSTLETTLVTIFKYPQIHGADFGDPDAAKNRSLTCPMITPDPNEPITSYPMEFEVDFGEEGCSISDHPVPSSGKMKIIVDGEVCVAEGAKITIKPEPNFIVNNYRCTVKDGGCIEMIYRGRDENGHMCFDSDLSNVCIIDINGWGNISLTQLDDAQIKVKDIVGNNDPNRYDTYLDDEVCITFSVLYCGAESDVTRIIPWLKLDGSYDPVGFHWSKKCPKEGGVDIWSGEVSGVVNHPDASVGWTDSSVTINGMDYDLTLCD